MRQEVVMAGKPGDDMTFASLLRTHRVAAGLSQEQLAERAGVGVRTIGDLERGRVRRPHRQSIMLLATALGLSAAARDELARVGHRLPGPAEAAGGHVPRQLPPAVPHFAGRADALRALTDLSDAAADGGTVVISAIDGMAGIGKTALAVHWAHMVADRFPDGQLYVNLRGFGPADAPAAPAEALRGFLDALGVPSAQMPVGLDAQSARYRSLLADRRVLVLLDNAHDAEQVRPLLPGSPGCLVVVTSRAQLLSLVAAQGAHPLTLDLLTVVEARELLTRRLGADRVSGEQDAADELIELCGRLPLALNIAAARAASQPAQPLADVASQLRDAQRRLDMLDAGDPATDVRAVFSWSSQNLSGPAARMFRLIGGASPGPDISAPAAAVLADLPPDLARRTLDELTAARLLTEQPSGRFSLHDLLGEYAAELSKVADSPEQTTASLRRLTGWYGQQAVTTARVLEPALRLPAIVVTQAAAPVVPDPAQALAWFEAERANLVAAAQKAAELDWHHVAAQISVAMWSFFQRSAYLEDRVLASEIAVKSARQLDDDDLLAWALKDRGQVHGMAGNFADSHRYLTEALAIRRRTSDGLGEASVLNSLAVDLLRQERFEDALDYLRPAIAIVTDLGEQPFVGIILNNIGETLLHLKRHDEALGELRQALAIRRECGDRFGEGITESTIGHAYLDLGHFREAVDHYQRALAAFEGTNGEQEDQALVLYNLGSALASLGRAEEAHDAWRAAIPILDRNNDPRAIELRARLASNAG